MTRHDEGRSSLRTLARCLSIVALAGAIGVAAWPLASDALASAAYDRQFVQALDAARNFDAAQIEAQLVAASRYNAELAGGPAITQVDTGEGLPDSGEREADGTQGAALAAELADGASSAGADESAVDGATVADGVDGATAADAGSASGAASGTASLAAEAGEAGLGYDEQLGLQEDALAWLEIPRLGLKLPVYRGSGGEEAVEARLLEGAVHVPQTSLPVGGASTHAAITAHTGVSHSSMFDNLGKLEPGDKFSLWVMGEELVYEVYDVEVVMPEEAASALDIVKGEDLVTLITCTPYGVNDHRILVHARRVQGPAAPVEQAASRQEVASTPKSSPGKAAAAPSGAQERPSSSALPKTGDMLASPRVMLFAGAIVFVAVVAACFAGASLWRSRSRLRRDAG